MPNYILPALLFFLWVLKAGQAEAQRRDALELKWSAPPGCPDAEAVRTRVGELAGTAEAAASPLQVEGTITRKAEGTFQLRLFMRVEGMAGAREIEGKACHDLAGAAAVALALLLRSAEPLTSDDLAGRVRRDSASADQAPNGVDQSASDENEPATVGPVAVSVPPPTAAVESTHAKVRSWRALLQMPLAALCFGPLRKPNFGLAAAAGVALGPWSLLADAGAWLPQRATMVREAERYGARIRQFSAGLRACRAFLGPRFQLAPCASISVEHLSARGTGPHIAASDAKATWVAAGVGAQATFNVARWLDLFAAIDARVQTSHPRIALEGVGTVEKLLPVAVTVRLGTEWIL